MMADWTDDSKPRVGRCGRGGRDFAAGEVAALAFAPVDDGGYGYADCRLDDDEPADGERELSRK